MEQKLAAILAADMVGYSRLMEANEKATLARLQAHRIELIDPSIARNHGRIVKTTGDGILVEFQSVTDAVQCAMEVQARMHRRNADVPEEERIQFRVGINIGDVIHDDDDIFGDGVNIAARLEQLADVGGVCVSAAVFNQVEGRLEIEFEDLGEKILKNISRPVRAYRIVPEQTGGLATNGEPISGLDESKAKPTVAVLPFDNMSGDPEQEFFVDGLTEDILTELSRRRELFVISRNSTFVYKGKAVNIREVAQSLGAQYLVEGSVRKAGDRLRVTVQLIDTESDTHIWAERYDRKLDDIFAIQDEVTSSIVATLPGRVEAAKHDQLTRKKPSSMAAYECVLAAKVLHHRSNYEDNRKALSFIDRAIELDPKFAHAHAWKACILGQAWGYGWLENPDIVYAEAESALRQAISLDDNDADVHRLFAGVSILHNDLSRSMYHQERALALNPNYDLVVVQMGELYSWLGRPEEGIEWIRKAMRLNPHHPERFWSHLGKAYFDARQYKDAIEAFLHLSSMNAMQHAFISASYGYLGDQTAATAHVERLRQLDTRFDREEFLNSMHYQQAGDLQHLADGLSKAGLE